MAAKGPKGYMAQLKQRLGERFPLLKEISQNFQHGQVRAGRRGAHGRW
jgi:hypothetical protein